jgi:integrase
MAQKFINERRTEDGISEKTANHIRSTLHALFTYAIKYHDFASKDRRHLNPADAVKLLPVPRKPIKHLESLDRIDEQLAAVEHDPVLHAAVAIAIYAGLRRSELIWLEKKDVDLDRHQIHIHAKTVDGESWQPKTAESTRAIRISDALFSILRRYRPSKSSPWYLPAPMGGRWQPDGFNRTLERANKRAGLKSSWLVFRHTFGSMLAKANVSLFKIAKLMGNSPEIARRHYADLQAAELTQEVEFDNRSRLSQQGVILDASTRFVNAGPMKAGFVS